jgi:hypothetical protein
MSTTVVRCTCSRIDERRDIVPECSIVLPADPPGAMA